MSGEVRPRITFGELTVNKDGVGEVGYKIVDKRLQENAVQFACMESGFEISEVTESVIKFTKTNPNLFPILVAVVLRSKGQDLQTIQVPVKHVGAFKIVPPLVSANSNSKIRLFLVGGVGDFKDAKTAVINGNKEVGVQLSSTGSSTVVTFDPLPFASGRHRVQVKIGTVEFSFQLHQKGTDDE